MKVQLWLNINMKGAMSARVEKIVDLDFAPVSGMQVEDYAWKSPMSITSVSFHTERPDIILAYFGLTCTESDAEFRQLVEMYQDHGWDAKVHGEHDAKARAQR